MPITSASLHDVDADAHVRIRTILFEQLREACAALGLHAGQTVRVRHRGAQALLLELPWGHTAALRREWTPFIEVEPHAPDAAGPSD